MRNLIEDLSILTTINTKDLNKLIPKIQYSIVDAVHDNVIANNCCTQIDVGIGILSIEIVDEHIRYKFVPNNELEHHLISTIKTKQNLLDIVVDKTLVDRITNIYKEYIS